MTENGAEPGRMQVPIPPLMAQVPASINILELQRADGVTQPVMLINSANGTFAFPLDPDPAIEVGEALAAAGRRAKSAILTPPSLLLGPSGAPISFG
jgi:hypothetical protein